MTGSADPERVECVAFRTKGRFALFARAESDDVEALVALRDDVARWLRQRDIQQWLPGEFSAARMQAWVKRGDVFVHRRDGQVVAAVAELDEDPEIWDDDDDGAAYIHLLMVDRAHAGLGLGDAALAFAEEQVRDRGGRVARLDAVAANAGLRSWYQARGYRLVGSRAFEEPELFDSVLLEKTLS